MGGVGGVGGGAREPLPFLPWEVWGGGPGRRAGGGDGGSSTRAEGSEVDGGHQDTLDVGAWCQTEQCGFDLAGDEGGRGEALGGVGRGGRWGGAPAVWGALVPPFLGSLKNQTIGLIWEMGGRAHQRAVWEQQGVRWFHLLGSLKNPTIGLIWLVTRWGGGVRGVGQGGGQGGGR